MGDRLAVVAGAGGPLGRTVAAKLADIGYSVVGIDRNEDGLRLLPEGVRRVTGDPADPTAAKTLIDAVAAEAPPTCW